MSHNLHFELLCMLLRKLPVVIHVNNDLWSCDSFFVNKKRFNKQSKGQVLYTVLDEDSTHIPDV